ncbi:MAG: PEP-CTERM sorting domain-containing protein [Planctomycetota bacterium]
MIRIKTFLGAAAALSLMATGPATAQIELVNNGGFETGDFTGYVQFPTGAGQQNVVSTNPSSGNFAAEINNDAAFSNSLFKAANLAPGLLTPGQTVNISFDARGSYATPGGVAFAEFFTELAGGGTSSGGILGGAPLAIDSDPDVWTTFNFTTTVGPDASGGVTLQLGATNGDTPGTIMYYDNLSVTVDSLIPEPTSLLLMGLGGLTIVGRRRKKA